jgi:hypothetical protein
MHFWPLTDWKFISPLSYYERAHFGVFVALFETAIAGLCMSILWTRFSLLWVRIALSLLVPVYILNFVGIFFLF